MSTPKAETPTAVIFNMLHQQRPARWLRLEVPAESIHGHKVHATLEDGSAHEGYIRVRKNGDDGRLSVDLLFSFYQGRFKRVDTMFHLSAKQVANLQKHDGEDFDY